MDERGLPNQGTVADSINIEDEGEGLIDIVNINEGEGVADSRPACIDAATLQPMGWVEV